MAQVRARRVRGPRRGIYPLQDECRVASAGGGLAPIGSVLAIVPLQWNHLDSGAAGDPGAASPIRFRAKTSSRLESSYDQAVFATLLGALPRPTAAAGDVDQLIERTVRGQEDAGLEPITDGRLGRLDFERVPVPEVAVDAWRSTQAVTERAVKQALPGPFVLGGGVELADALADVVLALAEAGCPLVEIEESGLDRLGDEAEQRRFRDAHQRLLATVTGTRSHLSLSIVGGSPGPDAWATVLELPYASLAVDLIKGPDSWNLVTRWPGDRGVIAGVESAGANDEPKEVLLWATHYAASTKGRGRDRVGIGSAGSWANLTWDVAVRKMRLLGEAARLATMPPSDELARSLDPNAVSSRRAALGHDV
jgi:hypothetical protein